MAHKPRVALFIDAENAAPKHLADYVEHCAERGKLAIARCYGSAASLKKWDKAMAEHHVVPVLTPPGAAGRGNASDFALTIDAVSLLHRDLFDHAVIASSDADFVQLAVHIREHGKGIDGVGESKAPKPLRSAFDTYAVFGPVGERKAAAPKPAPAAKTSPASAKRPASPPDIDTAWLDSMFATAANGGATAGLQSLARLMAAKRPDYRKGYRTVENYLRKSGLFDVKDGTVSRVAK
jgi:hypothetical protein